MTVGILETWEKGPGEKQDYDITFVKYLTTMGESTGAAHTVAGAFEGDDVALTLHSTTISAGIAKMTVSGGTAGKDYLLTATVTTAAGRVHQGHILIQVRETPAP